MLPVPNKQFEQLSVTRRANASKSLKPGPLEALALSVRKNVESAGLIFQTVWGLITRETSPNRDTAERTSSGSGCSRRMNSENTPISPADT